MFYKIELDFLIEIFKRIHVSAITVSEDEYADRVSGVGLESVFGEAIGDGWSPGRFPSELNPTTVYKALDSFGLSYIYLLLPETEKKTVLFIGPYLRSTPSKEYMLELGEHNGVSPKQQKYLEEYYRSVPLISSGSELSVMLDTFCELIWKTKRFATVDLNEAAQNVASPINEPLTSDGFDDILVNMKAMEKRYEFENEMMRVVALGQIQMEERLLAAFSDAQLEKRVADPLRNAKNYGIIMNTLLRKAVENGGVHPMYIDRVSSEFAQKIEELPSLSENGALMREMFRSYCRLVRKHSMKRYSLLTQKTVMLIETDLSADLSLSTLAKAQGVSASYLSSSFKNETGKTVSEFIREKRIKHAMYLLETTRLQVQTVALHCGIIDVQYFSKVFKRQTGKTPREYREEQNKL